MKSTKPQHTLGPWHQVGDYHIRAEDGQFICILVPEVFGRLPANAALIAGAPELLEALLIAQKKLSVFNRTLSPLEVAQDKELDFIRAAIAKVRRQL
jgi:hypothetical protein